MDTYIVAGKPVFFHDVGLFDAYVCACKEKKASTTPEKDDRDLFGYTSYAGLWKVMKERKISKKKLIELSGISVYDYRKMKENKDVDISILRRICITFSFTVSELVKFKKVKNLNDHQSLKFSPL